MCLSVFFPPLTVGLAKGLLLPGPCRSTHCLGRSTSLSCGTQLTSVCRQIPKMHGPHFGEWHHHLVSKARNWQVFLHSTLLHPALLTVLVNSLKYLSRLFLSFHSRQSSWLRPSAFLAWIIIPNPSPHAPHCPQSDLYKCLVIHPIRPPIHLPFAEYLAFLCLKSFKEGHLGGPVS